MIAMYKKNEFQIKFSIFCTVFQSDADEFL